MQAAISAPPKATALQQQYNSNISDSFPMQVVLLVSVLRREIEKIEAIRELADLVIVKFVDLCASFWEVCSVLILFLTILVTVALAERSFSKLKLIKNYTRNSMSQQRLTELAILNIQYSICGNIRGGSAMYF